ncbi:energy transducer TonB [Caballeronia sp. LjRoot34]|uniref:energy transducer TonB n=1 Tax=Caballeronia sp. LjRoot34 TaxID=3342325 RepID=UPI003ECD3B16
MSAWTSNGTIAARRRMAALQCATGTSASGVTMCRPLPQDSGLICEVRQKRLCLVVLAVLVAHGLAVVEMRRAMMSDTAMTRPRVLDVEFSMQDVIPQSPSVAQQPAILPHENAARPALVRPRTPSPTRSPNDAKAHRSMSEPRRAMPSADVTRAKPASPTPAPAFAQSSTDTAVAQTPVPSTVAPPSPPPVAEPLTEPGFGAAYLHNPAPAYPAVALQRGWQGTVLLKVHVLANGRADHVALLSTSGHPSLDDAAAVAVADWSFVPARRGAQAIDGWVQVPIDFKLGT